ncbi:NACHT, LRR and PYD domains-containing protein 3 [Bagarius yarrelli]|uniref:NACHT, LRR and PYD domains-containing protein 3 n=1 Tax=Bagarius yarrelli TaxID=175774 RepID=A0A556VUC7_BAGYA|nr:NACHT, LRR and PYD domains-containing protein 3 [Bagarius yarrelli]
MEMAKELICGLGKLAEQCMSVTCTHSDLIRCGLQPFLGSQILSDILRISTDDATSSDATFSFMSPIFKDFLRAVSFYLDYNNHRILKTSMEIHDYHFFLAGLSDPMQRKLLETAVGLFNSGQLSKFHSWLMRTAAELLPGMNKTNHWQVLRLLHHTLSPTLVKQSVGSCKWRLIGYGGMQEADCAALAFVVRCLGEMQHLNLYMSSLTEEQAEKLMSVFRLAKTINLDQSSVNVSVMKHFARALKEGQATEVSLSHCKLGDEAVKILCSSITHSSLHTLNLWDCCVTPACSEVLAEMLTVSKLCVLNLGANEFNDEGLARLITALGTSMCTLQNLCLNDCQLTGSCCPALSAALQSEHCSLTDLDLSVNELDESGALLICEALKSPNCSLENLEMVDLTDACLNELCDAVMACGSLTNLILKNNNLTDVSVPRLVELVRDRPVLQLNVQYNDFSEDVFELMDSYETIRY